MALVKPRKKKRTIKSKKNTETIKEGRYIRKVYKYHGNKGHLSNLAYAKKREKAVSYRIRKKMSDKQEGYETKCAWEPRAILNTQKQKKVIRRKKRPLIKLTEKVVRGITLPMYGDKTVSKGAADDYYHRNPDERPASRISPVVPFYVPLPKRQRILTAKMKASLEQATPKRTTKKNKSASGRPVRKTKLTARMKASREQALKKNK
jgi:hypothetical protein